MIRLSGKITDKAMKPVLFNLGNYPISSFGLSMILAFLAASFVIWRVIRLYELDEEKIVDLILVTFVGGLISARIYYILFHLNLFDQIYKVFLINRYPGLSFWGAFLGSLVILKFFARRLKVDFWLVADITMPGLFVGLVIGSIGCLLGSCQYGLPSNLSFAVSQVGLIGKRFPLQVVEALLFFIGFIYLWRRVLKFHINGVVAALGLILLGVIKFALEFYRGDRQFLFGNISLGHLYSIAVFLVGLSIYYSRSKKSLLSDIKFVLSLPINKDRRGVVLNRLGKNWYNLKVNFKVSLQRKTKKIMRGINVKTESPKLEQ
ncbi:prolipoprotein diacylglyceryl transferase [Candidatus Daviesbacteria bacterium]|nr:prolipoprotein diacylglyceryl transferase [Candidatus Daviesbacteria bacterium]